MSVNRLNNQDKSPIRLKHIGLLGITIFSLVSANIAFGSEIKVKDIVYVAGQGANGTTQYSNNPAHPQSWDCKIEPGQWEVEDVDPKFNIINVNGCWIDVNNSNLSIKPPKPTSTPFPTQNPFIPLPTSTPQE